MNSGTALVLAGLGFTAFMVIDSVEVVSPGEVGVPVTLGKVENVNLEPGVHFVAPLLTSVKRISTQFETTNVDVDAATSDLQQLPKATVALSWSVNPATAGDIVKNFGSRDNLFQRVVNPNVEEALKAATAQYTATELLTKRADFSADLRRRVTEALKPYPVTVQDINVTNFAFSPEFTRAVEANQVAARREATAKAEAAANVAKAKGEAEVALTIARSQAEQQRLLARSVTPETIRLRELEVQAEAIKRWDGKLPQVSTGGSNTLFQLPVTK